MNNIYFGYKRNQMDPKMYFSDFNISEELTTKFEKLLDRVNEDEIGWIVRENRFELIVKGHIRTILLNNDFHLEKIINQLNERLDLHFEFLSKDKPTLKDLESVYYDVHNFRCDKTGPLLDCLENNGSHFTDEEVWKLIIDTWTYESFTSLCSFRHSNFRDLFKLRKPLKKFLDFFDDEVIVYRGGNSKKGVSWSLSRDVGELFQRDNERHNYGTNKRSKLYQMIIKKEDILFFHNFRQELEVVVLPKEGRKTFHQEIKELKISNRTLGEIKTHLEHFEVSDLN